MWALSSGHSVVIVFSPFRGEIEIFFYISQSANIRPDSNFLTRMFYKNINRSDDIC